MPPRPWAQTCMLLLQHSRLREGHGSSIAYRIYPAVICDDTMEQQLRNGSPVAFLARRWASMPLLAVRHGNTKSEPTASGLQGVRPALADPAPASIAFHRTDWPGTDLGPCSYTAGMLARLEQASAW